MKDYVPREALIALARPGTFATSCDGAVRQEDAVPVRVIQGVPAADVVEVRHGQNIGEDYNAVDQFVCSECGIELQGWYRVERDMDDGEETHYEYVMRYCPNCGAKVTEV